ncbi:uncharacterized protein [Aristolochia californica]|uniref:uncharacterized protein n=1 Tax=Aristolochia californica TaxID=171875 RepID=UPI0035DDEF26
MAKKKVAPPAPPSDSAESIPQPAMTKKNLSSQTPIPGSEQKTKNLQALNSMLVKQTVELRQQVHSLTSSKESLQSDLNHFAALVQSLRSSSSLFQDQTIEFEVQDSVSRICVSNALQEMVSAAEKVKEELIQKLLSSEALKQSLQEEVTSRCRGLDGHMEIIMAGKKETEVQLETIRKESERFLGEFGKVALKENPDIDYKGEEFDDLHSVLTYCEHFALKFKELKSEKHRVELQKAGCEFELTKLRQELGQLQSEVSSERQVLECVIREKDNLDKVLQDFKKKLAKRNAEKEEHEHIMAQADGKIDELNATIKLLTKNISELQRELSERETLHREELTGVLHERDSLKQNLVSLQHQEEALRLEFSKFEEWSSEDKDASAQLLLEYERLVNVKNETVRNLDIMRDAKDIVEKKLEDSVRKLNGLSREMKETVEEKEVMEKARIEIEDEMDQLRDKCKEQEETNNRLQGGIRSLQDVYARTVSDKDNLQKELDVQTEKSRQDLQKLQTRAEDSELVLKRALSMLRENVEMMGRPEGEQAAGDLGEQEDALVSFMVELEIIKKIFKSKSSEMEKLRKDLKSLRIASHAQKKLCLWSWVSSAAFIIAASIAYISRGR